MFAYSVKESGRCSPLSCSAHGRGCTWTCPGSYTRILLMKRPNHHRPRLHMVTANTMRVAKKTSLACETFTRAIHPGMLRGKHSPEQEICCQSNSQVLTRAASGSTLTLSRIAILRSACRFLPNG